MTHVGWPRRDGDRRPDDEHRSEAGRQQLLGPGLRLRLLEGDAGRQLHPELRARGATQPTPVTRVYDVNGAVGGPIVRDKLWYYMSARIQGSPAEHAERLLQQERRQRELRGPTCQTSADPAFSDRTWENYTPRITWQITPRNKITGSWDEQPVCRKLHRHGVASAARRTSSATSPEADGHGEFSPQRVQTARWTSPMTNQLLLEAGFGTTYYQWAGKRARSEPDAESGASREHRAAHGPRRHHHRDVTGRRTG